MDDVLYIVANDYTERIFYYYKTKDKAEVECEKLNNGSNYVTYWVEEITLK